MESSEYDQNENGIPKEYGGASVPGSEISSIENSKNSAMRPDNANTGSRASSACKETSASHHSSQMMESKGEQMPSQDSPLYSASETQGENCSDAEEQSNLSNSSFGMIREANETSHDPPSQISAGSNVGSSHSSGAGAMSERSTKSPPPAVDSPWSCPELNESPASSCQEPEYLPSEASEDTANLSMLVHFPSSSPEETGPDSLALLDWQRVPPQKCSSESRKNTHRSEHRNLSPPRRNLDSSARLDSRVDSSPSTQDTLKQSHLHAETRSHPKHLLTHQAEASKKGGEIVETPFHLEGNFVKRRTKVSSETAAMTSLNGSRPDHVSQVLGSEAAEERSRTQLPPSEQGSRPVRNLRPTHLSSFSSSSCILESKSAAVPPIKRSSESESRMRSLADQRPNNPNAASLFSSRKQDPNSSKIVATRFLSPTFYPQSYHSVSSGPNTPTRKDIFALVSDNDRKLHFRANEGTSVRSKRFRDAASSARGTSFSSVPLSVPSDNQASLNELVPVTQNMETTASRRNVDSQQKQGESETVKRSQSLEEEEFVNNSTRGSKKACNKPNKSGKPTKRPTFFRKKIEQIRNLLKRTPKTDAPLNRKRNSLRAGKSTQDPVPSLEHVDIVADQVQIVSPCSASQNLEVTDSSRSNESDNYLQLNGCTSPRDTNQEETRRTYKAEVPRYEKLRCNNKRNANDHKIMNNMPNFPDSLENVHRLNRDQTDAFRSVGGVEAGCIPESLELRTRSPVKNLSNAVPAIDPVKKLGSRVINPKPRKNSSEQTANLEPNYSVRAKSNHKAPNEHGKEKTSLWQRSYVTHQTPLKDVKNEEGRNLYNEGNPTSENQYQNLPSGGPVPCEVSSNFFDRNKQSANTRKARVSSTDVTDRSSHSNSQEVVYENTEFLNFLNNIPDISAEPPKEKYSSFSPEYRAERNSLQHRNKSATPVNNPPIPRDPPPSRMAMPSTSSTSSTPLTRAQGATSNSMWVPENPRNMHRCVKKPIDEPATMGALTNVSSIRQRHQITSSQRNVRNSTSDLPVSGYVNSSRIEQRKHSSSNSRFEFGNVARDVQGKREKKHWIKPETTVSISESDSGYVVMTNYHTRAAKCISSVSQVESSSDALALGSEPNASIGLNNTNAKDERVETPRAQPQEYRNLNPPNSLAAAEGLQMERPNTTQAPTMLLAFVENMQMLVQMYEAQIQSMTQAYLMAQTQMLALIWRTAQNPIIEYNTRISTAVTTVASVPVLAFEPMTSSRVQRAISFPRARQSLSLECESSVRINGQSLDCSDNIPDFNNQLVQNRDVRYSPEPQTNRSANESSNVGLTTESSPLRQRGSPFPIMPPVNSSFASTTNTKTVAAGSSSKMSLWSPENLNPGPCQNVPVGNQGYSSLGGPRGNIETKNGTVSNVLGANPDQSNRFHVPRSTGEISRNELEISPLNTNPNFSGNLHVVTQENTTNSTTNELLDTFFRNLMASTVTASFQPDTRTTGEGNLFRADVNDVLEQSTANPGGAGETSAGGEGATEVNEIDEL